MAIKLVDTTFLSSVIKILIKKITGKNEDDNATFGNLTFDDGTVVSSDDGALKVTSDETRTVATLEDDTQELSAKSVAADCFISGDKFYLMPGQSAPEGYDVTDSNYGGEILTSKARSLSVVSYTASGDEVPVHRGIVTKVVDSSTRTFAVDFVYPYAASTTKMHEGWVLFEIPANKTIDITWSSGFTWLSPQPKWEDFGGYTFIIRVLNNNVFILSYFPTSGSEQNITLEGGPLNDAVAYAANAANANRSFQWILRETVGNDVVTKPIWHLGNGRFIDALGYVLNEGGREPFSPVITQ